VRTQRQEIEVGLLQKRACAREPTCRCLGGCCSDDAEPGPAPRPTKGLTDALKRIAWALNCRAAARPAHRVAAVLRIWARRHNDLGRVQRAWPKRASSSTGRILGPNVELTGTTRHTGLADGRMMNLCARRPGRYAVACPVERHVRRRLLAQASSIGEVVRAHESLTNVGLG